MVQIGADGQVLEAGELRAFLQKLDEMLQIAQRVQRRFRDARVVELVSNPELKVDSKAEFAERDNLTPLVQSLNDAKIPATLAPDEEHSTWKIGYFDTTNMQRWIGVETLQQPEYKKLRIIAKDVMKYNRPPFVVVKEPNRDTQADWKALLAYVKSEGMRDVTVQRYKGLGEMNPEQLWSTTMNAETRTLLRVDLKDIVESDEIFSTLMGEDVEARRKFIEDNALDVRNLDV